MICCYFKFKTDVFTINFFYICRRPQIELLMERIGKIILAVLILAFAQTAFAQNWTIDGVVLDKKSNKPVEFATVILGNTEQWAVADANGKIRYKECPVGQ